MASEPVICGFDIETTGLRNGDHKIIEVYLGLWKGGTRIYEYEQRIDPQRSIGADAQRVHGISIHDLMGQPVFATVAPNIVAVMSRADYYAGHNIDEFDLPFLHDELKPCGLVLPERPTIDTFNATWATPDGKKPSLKELCFACGIDYDTSLAHAARYDVGVNMAAILNAIKWGYIELPASAASLAA